MQLLKSGETILVLEDENTVTTLDSAVRKVAMGLYIDTCLHFREEKNDKGNLITEEHLYLEIDVLNALPSALLATNK